MTPRSHPEIAGLGVELALGKGKRDFRMLNNCDPKNLHANVLEAFKSLTIERMRKFARKTRTYKRGYRNLHAGGDVKDHHGVENFVKAKTHRSTFDQETRFLAEV